MSAAIQLRGHCQCCGRLQAVPAGTMSKHGYEVKSRGEQGWFSGVCQGERYKPIEVERSMADNIIKSVREDAARLKQHAADLRSGKVKPKEAKSGNSIPTEGKPRYQWPDEMVPFDQAPKWHQEEAVTSLSWKAQRRGEIGESFAAGLEKLCDEYHGKPLQQVKRDDGPAPIAIGEKRIAPRGVLEVVDVFRGMVTWKDAKGARSKMSTRSWRLLPVAAAEVAS